MDMRTLSAFPRAALLLLSLLVVLGATACSGERVAFPSATRHGEETAPAERISGILYKPEGKGPFPAVVHLHGCGGIQTFNRQLAERMTRWGYVSLVVDSFSPRGMERACGRATAVLGFRTRDAYGALRYLQGLPYVDPERVGAVGFSQGAWVLLLALREESIARPPAGAPGTRAGHPPFRAGVAYYPHCPVQKTLFYAPLLILIGDKDDWTFSFRCEALAEESRAGGEPVRLHVYPGVFHGFVYGVNRTVRGHRIVSDPDATEDSIGRLRRFLAERM